MPYSPPAAGSLLFGGSAKSSKGRAMSSHLAGRRDPGPSIRRSTSSRAPTESCAVRQFGREIGRISKSKSNSPVIDEPRSPASRRRSEPISSACSGSSASGRGSTNGKTYSGDARRWPKHLVFPRIQTSGGARLSKASRPPNERRPVQEMHSALFPMRSWANSPTSGCLSKGPHRRHRAGSEPDRLGPARPTTPRSRA